MTPTQQSIWLAVQARLRRGLPVANGVEQCRQAGIRVRVVRLHLGRPAHTGFGRQEDVSAEYGLTPTSQHTEW